MSKIGRCGDCRYFGKQIDDYGLWNDEGKTSPEVAKFHACNLLKHMNGNHDFSGIAGVVDGSGYHATFCVSEEFGCNQFEKKLEL